MTKKQIEELREKWKQSGDPPCNHPTLRLLKTEKGYFTGEYHCLDCGAPVKRTED
jgi:hypothetical protein